MRICGEEALDQLYLHGGHQHSKPALIGGVLLKESIHIGAVKLGGDGAKVGKAHQAKVAAAGAALDHTRQKPSPTRFGLQGKSEGAGVWELRLGGPGPLWCVTAGGVPSGPTLSYGKDNPTVPKSQGWRGFGTADTAASRAPLR